VAVTRRKGVLLVTGEAGLCNGDLLENSRLLARVAVLTFCLRRMHPVSFPLRRNHGVRRGSNNELNSLMGVTVLPNQLVPSSWDPKRKGLPHRLCLSSFERFTVQPELAGASDYLHFFGLKNSLVGRTKNTDRFGGLSTRECDRLSENNEQRDKTPSCCTALDHRSSKKICLGLTMTSASGCGFFRHPFSPPASENAVCPLSR
jgi:hypothetical protein